MHARFGSIWIMLSVLLTVLSMPCVVAGQADDYAFNLSSPTGAVDDVATVILTFDIANDVSAWSFGVCHDTLVSLSDGDVVNGSATNDANNGNPPAFQGLVVTEGGWTVGVIVDLTGGGQLPAGSGLEMYKATYTCLQIGDAPIQFCETLGDPVVEMSLIVGSEEVEFAQNNGTIFCIESLPPFTFSLPEVAVEYRPELGEASVTISPSISEDPDNLTFPSETQGFSMGIEHDTDLMTALSVAATGPLLDLNGGDGPEYLGINLDASGRGVTVGVVYVFLGGDTIAFATDTAVLEINYQAAEDQLLGNEIGASSNLTFVQDMGSPVVKNKIVVGGFSQEVQKNSGSASFIPILVAPFLRGDCNDDGLVHIGDGIFLLYYLFNEGPFRNCVAACDTNHDGIVIISDAIYLFTYLFQNGPDLDPPFPACGKTEDLEEDCEVQEHCAD